MLSTQVNLKRYGPQTKNAIAYKSKVPITGLVFLPYSLMSQYGNETIISCSKSSDLRQDEFLICSMRVNDRGKG